MVEVLWEATEDPCQLCLSRLVGRSLICVLPTAWWLMLKGEGSSAKAEHFGLKNKTPNPTRFHLTFCF